MKKSIIYFFKEIVKAPFFFSALFFALMIGLFFYYKVIFAWTNPISTPPTGSGALSYLNGNIGIDGNVYVDGNVGIGTTNPSQKLTVNGAIESLSGGLKFPDGTIQNSAASEDTDSIVYEKYFRLEGSDVFTACEDGYSIPRSARFYLYKEGLKYYQIGAEFKTDYSYGGRVQILFDDVEYQTMFVNDSSYTLKIFKGELNLSNPLTSVHELKIGLCAHKDQNFNNDAAIGSMYFLLSDKPF